MSWSVEVNLVNDPQTLSELLDTAHVTVIAVTILSDGDVELNLFVCEFSCDTNGVPGGSIPRRIYRMGRSVLDPT